MDKLSARLVDPLGYVRSRRFDKLSDRMRRTSGRVRISMGRPFASLSLPHLVHATRSDQDGATPRSLSLSKGRTRRTLRRFDKLSDRMGSRKAGSRFENPPFPSLSLLHSV